MNTLEGLRFSKLEALGNDFMLIDGRGQNLSIGAERIRRLGDRRFGVGFDQLLMLKNANPSDEGVELGVDIFNADGSQAEQCGNGLRAIALWLDQKGELKEQLVIRTLAGKSTLVSEAKGIYSSSLPGLVFSNTTALPELPQLALQGQMITLGNPHLVVHWPHPPSAPELSDAASMIQAQPRWNNRCNIGLAFLQPAPHGESQASIQLRVHERGAGATRACGSGACAAAASMIQQHYAQSPLLVHQPGGTVMVNWAIDQDSVILTGPARKIYEGCMA